MTFEGKSVKQGKAYPYLKALLDGLIEASPNWMKAPAKFVSSLSEQLKDKGEDENRELEQEIKGISKDELRAIIEEAGCEQKENIELIAVAVQSIPDILQVIGYRFDRVDEKHDEIIALLHKLLSQKSPPSQFPLPPSLHNQTPPEENFAGREDMLETITDWFANPKVCIGAIIGWGGVGKSAMVRRWYDNLESNKIRPDGIFWWGFYRRANLELFLNALLRYISGGQIEPDTIKNTWEKMERIKEYIHQGRYLIILDGLEEMQKSAPPDEFGRMEHREFTELLHYLTDGPEEKGLCLITTRYPLKDIDDWQNNGYEYEPLVNLSIPDSLTMLKNRGVKGSDDDLTEVIERYKGHALSLTSLAGYLNKYFNSDIKQAPDIVFVMGDKKRFKDVNKLLRKYAEKMSAAERVFLNIFSLFRQEVIKKDFAGVFHREIEDTKFNDVLVKMSDLDFRDLVSGLVEWRLISYDETKGSYTTHPLTKGYFESDFDENDKKLCHGHIYQYFSENAPDMPDTLEEMEPLFRAVYHGCAAGKYQETHNEVYFERIRRGNEYYIVHKLGALGSWLGTISCFFEKPWSKPAEVLKDSDKVVVLNNAGFALRAVGRLREAAGPMEAAVKKAVELNWWVEAATNAGNLSELYLTIGEVGRSVGFAGKSVEYADKSGDAFEKMKQRVKLGDALHQAGQVERAKELFEEAERMQKEDQPEYPFLYSLAGYKYCDLLLSLGRVDEVKERARQTLELAKQQNWLLEIAMDKLSLGRAQLKEYQELKTKNKKDTEESKKAIAEAKKWLEDAVAGLREAGTQHHLPRGLFARAQVYREMGDIEKARGDVLEARQIAERGGMGLFMVDVLLEEGRIYKAMGEKEKVRQCWEKAKGLIKKTGYYRRTSEAEELK